MTPEQINQRVDEVFSNPKRIERAFAASAADVARRYAADGLLMAVWRDGAVQWIDPVTRQVVDRNVAPVVSSFEG